MKDIRRDRRTVMSMILFPIILMPVMSLGMIKFIMSRAEKIKEEKSTVVWISDNKPDVIHDAIVSEGEFEMLSVPLDSSIALKLLKDKDVDAVVFVPYDFYSELLLYSPWVG